MPFADSYRAASRFCFLVLGTGGGASLPVLVGSGAFEQLVFPSRLGRDGRRIWPPTHVGRFEARDGSLIELRALPRGGRGPEPDESLGVSTGPVGVSPEQQRAMREALFEAYDHLRPGFEQGSRADDRLCARTLELLDQLVWPPLRVHLDPLGAPFLAWLRAQAA